jgi:microtubule-associated protein-like 1/2
MSYSPDGNWLGVGSHDNTIYLYPIKKDGKYDAKKMQKLNGHSSFITAFDWCQESKWIRSVCGAYELLFFEDKKGKFVH